MGVCNHLPLVKSKGVHREMESEGSWRPEEHEHHQAEVVGLSLQDKAKSKDYTASRAYFEAALNFSWFSTWAKGISDFFTKGNEGNEERILTANERILV